MRYLTTFLYCLLNCVVYGQPLPTLIPYRDSALYGYSDTNGHIVLQPRWTEADFFKNGKARVRGNYPNTGYALIDTTGAYIIPPTKGWNGEILPVKNGLNAATATGMGYIDSTGKYIIPPVYEERKFGFNSRHFEYSTYLDNYYLPIKRDGKTGIIDTTGGILLPFEYSNLVLPVNYQLIRRLYAEEEIVKELLPAPALHKYVIAYRENDCALLTMDGNTIIPFGRYQDIAFVSPHWIIARDSLYALFDTNAHQITPHLYRTVEAINDSSLIVSVPQGQVNRYGVIYADGKDLLKPVYIEITRTAENVIKIKKSETIALTKNKLELKLYSQLIDTKTWQPLTDWEEEFITMGGTPYVCGYGRAQAERWKREEASYPRIMVDGVLKYTFNTGDTTWHTTRYVGSNKISVTGYIHGNRKIIHSVIDKERNFLLPVSDSLEVMAHYPLINSYAVKVWYNEKRSQNWAVADTALQLRTHPLQARIVTAFRWKGAMYTISSPYQGINMSYSYGGHYDEEPDWSDMRQSKLMDSSGHIVAVLAAYNIAGLANRQGVFMANSPTVFENVLLVTDSNDRWGYVDMNGKILFPAVSFRYPYLKGLGYGYFLISDGSSNIKSLVYKTGKEPFPGLRVYETSLAPFPPSYAHPDGVISLRIMDANNQDIRPVYFTKNGVLHYSTR